MNVRKTNRAAIERVLAGLPHRESFFHPTEDVPSSAPGSRSRLSAAPMSLREYLSSRMPGWFDDDPLLLLARGSALELVSTWLVTEEARELVSALVLVDDVPRVAGNVRPRALTGLVEFACDVAADPGEKMLVVASTAQEGQEGEGFTLASRLRAALRMEGTQLPGLLPQLCISTVARDPAAGASETAGEPELSAALLALLERELLPFLRDLGPASPPERLESR